MELKEAIKYLSLQRNNDYFDNKAIKVVLEELENSIPKKKIEDDIEELKNMNVGGEVFITAVNFAIKTLQELLEVNNGIRKSNTSIEKY